MRGLWLEIAVYIIKTGMAKFIVVWRCEMRLTKIKLHNYRCFGDGEQIIPINNVTALIGNNSSGKTAALLALNCLFSDNGAD